jgi:hypothetical protein
MCENYRLTRYKRVHFPGANGIALPQVDCLMSYPAPVAVQTQILWNRLNLSASE